MKKLLKSIILSAALLMGAAAVAPSASAAWSGWQNESGYSARVFTDAARHTRPAPQRWTGKPRKKAQAHFITRPAYTRSAAAAG